MTKGHIEPPPSGSFRAVVHAGKDPITSKPVYLRKTSKTQEGAVRLLGKLLEDARVGRAPETNATVGYLLDQYLKVAEIEPSTRYLYEGHVRRVMKPAVGEVEIRKVRGRALKLLYVRLRTCRDPCASRRAAGHDCRPLAPSTVRQIHAILSGAFATAVRWSGWSATSPKV